MLGGLLSRQAEEEERQAREEAEQEAAVPSPDGDAGADGHSSLTESNINLSRSKYNQYGSLLPAPPTNINNNNARCIEGEEVYGDEYHHDDEVDERSELEDGEYSYSDDDSDSDEGDSDEDDDDGYGSSLLDHLDSEGSDLLHNHNRQGQRRTKRRSKQQQQQQKPPSWKRQLSKSTRRLGRKIRSAIVAIADVDNVWDSPDANNANNNHNYNDGAYAEDPSANSAMEGAFFNATTTPTTTTARNYHTNQQGSNGNTTVPSSTIIYNVITAGTMDTSTGRNNRTAAIFWFIVLVLSYALERSTFKLLVDRVGPFRLFSVELILGCHALLTGVGMGIGCYWRRGSGTGSGSGHYGNGGKSGKYGINGGGGMFRFGLNGLPLADVGLMAVLDTIYLLLQVISGAHVPPVLTVILVQATIPLTACFTQCVHPDGFCSRGGNGTSSDDNNDGSSPGGDSSAAHVRISNTTLNEMDMSSYHNPDIISTIPNLPATSTPPPVKGWGGLSRYHIIGTCLMFLAIFLGLTPAVLSLDHIIITKKDAMPERTAYNTIVFCLAAVPAAISQLHKEHTMTRLRQPIDRNTLNMVLSIFQLLFAIVVSPLAYGLQGMGDGPGWTTLYPSKSIGENFSHGLSCFIGTLDDETMRSGYPEVAICNWAWSLVLLHVLSIIMVGVAIDKLAAATKVMYRGVSMGIIFAVILMFIYQIRDQWCEYGPLVSFFHLTSTAVLIVGAEIYHRVSLVDASFETVYPEIGDLYEDEE